MVHVGGDRYPQGCCCARASNVWCWGVPPLPRSAAPCLPRLVLCGQVEYLCRWRCDHGEALPSASSEAKERHISATTVSSRLHLLGREMSAHTCSYTPLPGCTCCSVQSAGVGTTMNDPYCHLRFSLFALYIFMVWTISSPPPPQKKKLVPRALSMRVSTCLPTSSFAGLARSAPLLSGLSEPAAWQLHFTCSLSLFLTLSLSLSIMLSLQSLLSVPMVHCDLHLSLSLWRHVHP